MSVFGDLPDRLRASARLRVLLVLVLVLLFAAVVTTVLLRQVLSSAANERVDAALEQEVEEYRRLAQIGRDPESGKPLGRDVVRTFDVFLSRNVLSHGEGIYTFVGTRLHRAAGAQLPVPPEIIRAVNARDTVRGELRAAGKRRYVVVPVRVGEEVVGAFAMTGDLAPAEREAAQATRAAAYASAIALVLATLLGLAVVGSTLRPLRDMARTARSITDSDLTRRIPVRGRDEIAQLGRTFNQMLDRLEAAFDSQRALVSDAGHELRTPITIIRGHLELLGEDPRERAETMALVGDELDRMSRLVDDLLTLAKAERTDFLRLEPLDLDELTIELHAKASALAPRDWQLGRVGTGALTGDRQRITQAVINLAENAARYAGEGATIEISSAACDGRYATLYVRDDGPGIPAAEQELIFERFARGAAAPRGEGSGLGLAIVDAIARAHGGHVSLQSWPGHGATFALHLPIEPN